MIKDVAASLRKSLGVVSYHMSALDEAGLIELTQPRSGAARFSTSTVPTATRRNG